MSVLQTFLCKKMVQKIDSSNFSKKSVRIVFQSLWLILLIEPYKIIFKYHKGEFIDSFWVENDFDLEKTRSQSYIIAIGFEDFVWKLRFAVETLIYGDIVIFTIQNFNSMVSISTENSKTESKTNTC